MERSKLITHLQELAANLELEDIAIEKTKRPVRMIFSPHHAIDFRELPKGISMSSTIGPCPQKNKEDFYLFLMRANFLGQGTGKTVIGMDLEEKNLTLSSYIPYDLDFKKFKESVENLLNFAAYWAEELDRYNAQPDATFIS